MQAGKAEEILKVFEGRRVLVVGDLILDKYVSGNVSRISPEAPVPVVHVTGEYSRPGGAANVAVNIRSLGGQAVVAGVVGADPAAELLTRELEERGILTDGVLASDRITTTVKTRVVAERQQVVRVDREGGPQEIKVIEDQLVERVRNVAGTVDGIIIEDYGKGVITQKVVDTILSTSRESGVKVGFDPKDNHRLKISGIALATPNHREACAAAGVPEEPLGDDPELDRHLQELSDLLQKQWETELLIITLGPNGMYLSGNDVDTRSIPTRAREVFDVSGAGDTVIATAFLSCLSGARHHDAASLANAAAGVVVAKLGTATCTPEELLAAMRS